MTNLTITRGLPASGKTTWARSQVRGHEGTRARVNRDDIRMVLHGGGFYGPGMPPTEPQVTAASHAMVEALLRHGTDVYVDDTNLRARTVTAWAELAARCGTELWIHDLTHVPLETCLARNATRIDPIPPEAIESMHSRYLAGRKLPLPVPEAAPPPAPYTHTSGAANIIMVDIDGTLAQADRDPYDTSRYSEDTLNESVAEAVYALFEVGYAVLFCSGRSEEHRTVTEDWLDRHFLRPYRVESLGLLMRPTGDTRRDDVVKLELFDRHVRPYCNVLAVFDDRDRVVRAWRSIGLTVFQVAPGDF